MLIAKRVAPEGIGETKGLKWEMQIEEEECSVNLSDSEQLMAPSNWDQDG